MSDATSPNSRKLATPDAAWSTLNAPLAVPTDYIDVMFDAEAGTPYTLWLRMRATNDNNTTMRYGSSFQTRSSTTRRPTR
jgi:hypothetical protein